MSFLKNAVKYLAKILVRLAAALAGCVAAMWIFTSFMVVEVDGSQMLPTLEPGQKVVAARFDSGYADRETIGKGDLVVYKPPYYHIDGRGEYLVRRVTGLKDEVIEVSADAAAAQGTTEIIERDIVLGKVIKTWVKKNAN